MFFNNKPLGRLDEISIYELVLGFASKVAGKEGGQGGVSSYNNFAVYMQAMPNVELGPAPLKSHLGSNQPASSGKSDQFVFS